MLWADADPLHSVRIRMTAMTKLETLEAEIEKLSPEELDAFRAWFAEFDWKVWDDELERDVADGKLDRFGEKALEALRNGKTKPL